MASSVPLQLAETIQTAHIRRQPSPEHDIAPSTAADKKAPVRLDEIKPADGELDGDDDIPYGVIKPRRRSTQLPPLPDLRFEQSYLHSIANANSWGAVAWVTVRDQVRRPPYSTLSRYLGLLLTMPRATRSSCPLLRASSTI